MKEGFDRICEDSRKRGQNKVFRYTNNAADDLLALMDGKSQTTRWNYDQYGRITNKLDQAGTEILRKGVGS